MNTSDWTSDRLSTDLEFKPVDQGPPRYANSTDRPVDHFAVVDDFGELTGYLWICDADDAAGFERRLASHEQNASFFWHRKLRAAKSRGLSPAQAAEELLADPGDRLYGHLLPESRATAAGLTELKDLAAADWSPPQPPPAPPGHRPDPPITDEQRKEAAARGGWLYRTAEGHATDSRVLPHTVEGAWQVDATGTPLRFWHNPRYGTTPAPTPAEPVPAGPVLPLGAGRRPAGRALLDWLEDERAPRHCRVAGSPGSGRTHLLSWLAASCPPNNPRTGRRVHALLPVEGLTVDSATWLLAHRLGLPARTPTDLLEALQDGVPRTLAVTDLDRAGGGLLPGMPERIAAELLVPLLQVPWLRLLVESTSGTAAAAVLTEAAPTTAVLDLDDPRWTDRDAFAAWHARQGTANTADLHPGRTLRAAAGLDPAAPATVRTREPAESRLHTVPNALRPAIRALAAAGWPLTEAEWSSLTGRGADRTAPAGQPPQPAPVTGERADADTGTAPVDHAAAVAALAASLPAATGTPDRADAVGLRGLILRHAVHAGLADRFLTDPHFLVHADPLAVTTALEHAHTTGTVPRTLAEAWHLAGPVVLATDDPSERAAALHAWLAGHDQQTADTCRTLSARTWRAHWSYGRGDVRVHAAAPGHGPLRSLLAVAVDHAVRFVEPETGRTAATAGPVRLPARHITGLAVGDDAGVFVLDPAGTITAVPAGNPGLPSLVAAAAPAHTSPGHPSHGLTALAYLDGPGGPALATAGGDGTAAWTHVSDRIAWHAPDHPLHHGAVTAVDLDEADGGILLVTGGADGTVRTWMYGRPPMSDPIDARDHPVTAVAVSNTPQGILIASAWADGLVRLRRWGVAPATADLRLGLPARSVTVTPVGVVCLALPEGVLGLTLD